MAARNSPADGRPAGADGNEPDGAEQAPSQSNSLTTDARPRTHRTAAFWGAVVLPFLHVPLLTTGLDSVGEQQAFLLLLALNLLALYVGRDYGPA